MPFVEGQNVDVRQVGDSDWELLGTITYKGNTQTFEIEPGFRTDFASVPKPLVGLFPRYGKYTKAAILHDFLWRTRAVEKVDANGIFRRAMRELGVPVVRRWMMWAAVGLVSTFKNPIEESRLGLGHGIGLGLVASLSLVFLLVPLLVVFAWQLLLALIELIAAGVGWVWSRTKPPDRRVKVNAPQVVWRLS